MSKQTGVYAVSYEVDGGIKTTQQISDAPDEIKVMIVQKLLRELKIPIRVEL